MVAVIRFACGTCGEKLSVPARYAGRKGVCPGCRALNRVPAASDASLAASAPSERAAPPSQAPALAPPPPARETARAAAPAPRADSTPAPAPAAPVAPPPAAFGAPAPAAAPPRPTAGWPEDPPARTGSLFGRLRRRSDEADAPLRREWDVDRGGLPMPVRVALLILVVVAFLAAFWGVAYGLLRLVVGTDE